MQKRSPDRYSPKDRKPYSRNSKSRSRSPRKRYSRSRSPNYEQPHKRSRLGSKEQYRERRHYRESPERRRKLPEGRPPHYVVDRHGNRPSNRLFIDRLPQEIIESDIRQFFEEFEKYIASVKLGTKPLKPGEYRTCIVSMMNREAAVDAREKLIGYQGPKEKPWPQPLLINFAKPRIEDRPPHFQPPPHHYHPHDHPGFRGEYSPPRYPPPPMYYDNYGPPPSPPPYHHRRHSPYGRRSPSPRYRRREHSPKYGGPPPMMDHLTGVPPHLHFDKKGNPASTVLNVLNFSVFLKKSDIFDMFPGCREIDMAVEKNKHGEFNVAYLYYDDIALAARERDQMFGFKNNIQPHALLINYSSRKPIDFPPPPEYGAPPPMMHPPSPHGDFYPPSRRRRYDSPPHEAYDGPKSGPPKYDEPSKPLPSNGETDTILVDVPAHYDRRDVEELFLNCKGLDKVKVLEKHKDEPGTFVVSFHSVSAASHALDSVSHKLKRENKKIILSFYK